MVILIVKMLIIIIIIVNIIIIIILLILSLDYIFTKVKEKNENNFFKCPFAFKLTVHTVLERYENERFFSALTEFSVYFQNFLSLTKRCPIVQCTCLYIYI